MVRGEWKRGHSVRGRGDTWPRKVTPLLPSPGDDFELGDVELGELAPDPGPEPPPVDMGEIPPDPEPSWLGDKDKPKRGRPAGSRTAKPTAAVRADIEAKFGLMLTIPGNIWAARDPYCGGAFLAQEPAIRKAGLDLILQSPDLIAFFTSSAAGFMLWLNLLTALQPVAMTIWAHHIIHAIGQDQGQGEPIDERQYAA